MKGADMAHFETWVARSPALCDGTPRRERGYRAFAQVGKLHPANATPEELRMRSMVMRSELFGTEAEAERWQSGARIAAQIAQV